MSDRRTYLGGGVFLAVGVALGVVLAGGSRPSLLMAGAGEHPDASMLLTGPISVEVDQTNNMTYTKDAVYFLNYSKGRLLAAIPHQIQTATSRQMLSDFAERDLVQDFGLKPRSSYHFEMTVGSIGGANGGLSPLYVFETTTGQMAIYQVKQQYTAITSTSTGMNSARPSLELLERRQDARLARAGHQTPATAAR